MGRLVLYPLLQEVAITDFSDFCAQITDWTNRQDFSSTLVTSLIRMAEADINRDLRIDRMINASNGTITSDCAPLPDDWLESDLMLIASGSTPTGWQPIRYLPRDEFFRLPNQPYSGSYASNFNSTTGFYTIEGRQVFFGGPPDTVNGTVFQLNYYQEVPVFSDVIDSWVYIKQPALYLNLALYHAALHAVGEEQSAANFKALADETITKLNADHQRARASGSRLARLRRRSFG